MRAELGEGGAGHGDRALYPDGAALLPHQPHPLRRVPPTHPSARCLLGAVLRGGEGEESEDGDDGRVGPRVIDLDKDDWVDGLRLSDGEGGEGEEWSERAELGGDNTVEKELERVTERLRVADVCLEEDEKAIGDLHMKLEETTNIYVERIRDLKEQLVEHEKICPLILNTTDTDGHPHQDGFQPTQGESEADKSQRQAAARRVERQRLEKRARSLEEALGHALNLAKPDADADVIRRLERVRLGVPEGGGVDYSKWDTISSGEEEEGEEEEGAGESTEAAD